MGDLKPRKELPEDAAAALKRYQDLVHNPDPAVTVVLQGHLLVEELLSDMIAAVAPAEPLIAQARLSFFQKALLAQALSRKPVKSPVWEAVLRLNTLRNDFMHRVTSEQRDVRVAEFVAVIKPLLGGEDLQRAMDSGPLFAKLSIGVAYLLGALRSMGNEHRRLGEACDKAGPVGSA